MNVAVTGLNVPVANAGIVTIAFVALTSEYPCNPVPESTWLTVTEFTPAVIASNAAEPPGLVSVMVRVGVQMPGVGDGVGVGFGVGVAVGVGVGDGVGPPPLGP